MSSDTPSKRQHRQTRNSAHTSIASTLTQHGQKSHHVTSQTIIASVESDCIVPSTPPRTPHKNDPLTTQTKSRSVPPESQQHQKSKNKSRPKNVNTSPAVVKNRQHSPSKSASINSSTKPITTPSSNAYAGSTFHASPAPSALPIPSYYSKSVPESPAGRLLLRNREVSNSTSNAASDAENGTASSREKTPLDFLFEADRQDKERARSASSTQQESQVSGPFQPPYSPSNTRTPPAGPSQARPPNSHRHSGGLFQFEMDSPNHARSPIGPAFSTPYNERMKAARATSQQQIPQTKSGQASGNAEDLKRYLFDGILPSQSSLDGTQQPGPAHQTVAPHSDQRDVPRHRNDNRWSQPYPAQTPRNNARYSGLRQEVTPTKTPNDAPDHNNYVNGTSQSGQHWAPPDIVNGTGPNNHVFQGPLIPQSVNHTPTKHNRELSDLDSHLRSVLNLGPAKNA